LWQASLTKRIFLMEWQAPWPLEEFLWPAALDWTVPESLRTAAERYHFTFERSASIERHDEHRIIEAEPGDSFEGGGMAQLWKAMNRPYGSGLPEVYQILFRLSPPVQKEYDKTLERLGLEPGNYLAAHLRARTLSEKFQPRSVLARSVDADGLRLTKESAAVLQRLSRHAVDCVVERAHNLTGGSVNAQQQQPQTTTVYFASDTNDAVRMMTKQSSTNVRVVGMVTDGERLHLSRNDVMMGGLRRTPVEAFYPAFVDLWILAGAACRSIGIGGYGLQAALMGGTECLTMHHYKSYFKKMNSTVNVGYCLLDDEKKLR
jgi:hypothetical protein